MSLILQPTTNRPARSEPLDPILVDALGRIHVLLLRGDRSNDAGLLSTLDAILHTALWTDQEYRAQFESEPVNYDDVPY